MAPVHLVLPEARQRGVSSPALSTVMTWRHACTQSKWYAPYGRLDSTDPQCHWLVASCLHHFHVSTDRLASCSSALLLYAADNKCSEKTPWRNDGGYFDCTLQSRLRIFNDTRWAAVKRRDVTANSCFKVFIYCALHTYLEWRRRLLGCLACRPTIWIKL